jgi:MFS family permease
MALGLAAALTAVSESAVWGRGSARTPALLALGAVALTAWARSELRSPNPVVDMGLMRLRGVWTANAGALLLGTAAVQLLLGPASGLLHRTFGPRRELIAGQLACAAGFAFLAAWHDAPWQVYAASVTLGIGFCLCLIGLPNQVVSAVPPAQAGSATAVNTVVRNVGGALGGQLAVALIVASAHSGAPTAAGYVEALVLCAGATAIGAVTAIAAPRPALTARTVAARGAG